MGRKSVWLNEYTGWLLNDLIKRDQETKRLEESQSPEPLRSNVGGDTVFLRFSSLARFG